MTPEAELASLYVACPVRPSNSTVEAFLRKAYELGRRAATAEFMASPGRQAPTRVYDRPPAQWVP